MVRSPGKTDRTILILFRRVATVSSMSTGSIEVSAGAEQSLLFYRERAEACSSSAVLRPSPRVEGLLRHRPVRWLMSECAVIRPESQGSLGATVLLLLRCHSGRHPSQSRLRLLVSMGRVE